MIENEWQIRYEAISCSITRNSLIIFENYFFVYDGYTMENILQSIISHFLAKEMVEKLQFINIGD